MKVLQNIKRTTTWSQTIPLLGIYSKKTKTLIQKDTSIPMFMATLFTIGKNWKQPKCPSTDEWIKIIYILYIFFRVKKEKNKTKRQPTEWGKISANDAPDRS